MLLPWQISVFARHARDEILLLASDGLWDVLSNQEATDLALRSIKRARVSVVSMYISDTVQALCDTAAILPGQLCLYHVVGCALAHCGVEWSPNGGNNCIAAQDHLWTTIRALHVFIRSIC